MSYELLGLTLGVAVVDWISVNRKLRWLEYFAKPATMLALLAWLWTATGFKGGLLWFGLGLGFSLAGDILLMLPREQFIPGLGAFLCGHLCYIIGFNPSLPPLNLVSSIMLVLVGGIGMLLYRNIAAGLEASGNRPLKLPVLVYAIIIGLMLLSALLTWLRGNWDTGPALLASAGALLFFFSDSTLAWNKFVAPLRFGRERVMVSYHLAQILLALGAALHFVAV